MLPTMASSSSRLLCLVLVLAVAVAPARSAVSCNQVFNYLTPCLNYVVGGGPVPSACCSGVQSLYYAARTTSDRQGVCNCLKNVVNGAPYNGNIVANAASLPGKCGINLPYKISPSTDCRSVK